MNFLFSNSYTCYIFIGSYQNKNNIPCEIIFIYKGSRAREFAVMVWKGEKGEEVGRLIKRRAKVSKASN